MKIVSNHVGTCIYLSVYVIYEDSSTFTSTCTLYHELRIS